jgi:phenylacetate-CoA ligase
MSQEAFEDWLRSRLADLLVHARGSCAYYQTVVPREARDDPLEALMRIPPLIKAVVRARFNDLISTSFRRSELHFSATGGSTGDPMPYAMDFSCLWMSLAARDSGFARAGLPPGGRILKVWGSSLDVKRDSSKLRKAWSRLTGTVTLPAFQMPSDIESWVKILDHWCPHILVGYAGALARFARLCLDEGRQPIWRPRGIIASAETLTTEMRQDIEAAFGAPVYNRYGLRELANVAQETNSCDGLEIVEYAKWVEILGPDDRPVALGDLGRIIVTDLWNYGFPLIRYDTGDVGRLGSGPSRQGRQPLVLAEVAGRVTDFLIDKKGNAVSGLIFPHLMKDFPAVSKFQARQSRQGDVEVHIVCQDALSPEDRDRIASVITRHLSGVPVRVELVKALPTPPSGKHRLVISECSQAKFRG